MTASTLGQWLQMYWGAAVFALGLIAKLIKMHNDLTAVKKEVVELREAAKHHDESDQKMKEELSELINRNKEAAELANGNVQNQLLSMNKSLARLEGLAEILVKKFT